MVQVARRLQLVDAAPMTHFAGFEPWLRANNCGNNTIEDRLNHLANFAATHPGFPDVTATQITNWLGRPNYAQWSRATYFGHLRSYFTFAVDVGFVQVDPMARMRHPKPGKSVPRPLTPAQVAVVLAAATNTNLHAWLILGLYAGLRAHEIAKIRGEDVEQDQLYVFGKGGQGKFLPTHPLIWDLAKTMPRAGWWFPTCSSTGHVRSTGVSTMTSRLFAANGIEGSIHRCRHTYATQLLRAGVNIRVVQTLMRHASLTSTQIYTAVDEDERRAAINRLVAA
jgi:site-specific recombinase XerD